VQAITQCMMHAVQCMPLVTSQRGACRKQSSTKRHSASQGHAQAKENITTTPCRSWNGDGKETNGHSSTCTARPANTMLAQRTPLARLRRAGANVCNSAVKACCIKRSRAKPTFENAAGMGTERRPTVRCEGPFRLTLGRPGPAQDSGVRAGRSPVHRLRPEATVSSLREVALLRSHKQPVACCSHVAG
jgi:hypothetical protein